MQPVPESTTGYVDVEGGKLYYEVAGTGHPFVLIHAGVADHHMWDDQFPVFAQRYRVIRYDTREFGLTTSENVSYSNRQDLYDLLRHLGVEKTYVMGCSRGGQIAVDFTLEHPDMVDALIVVGGGISGHEEPVTEAEMAMFHEMEAAYERKDYPTLIDLELRMWIDGPGQPETRVAPQVREKARAMITNNYMQHQSETPASRPLTPPADKRLGEIHVPVLAIVGDLDVSDTQTAMDYLARQVPNGKKVIMPGTAHLPNMEQPEPFTQIVLDFLGSLPA